VSVKATSPTLGRASTSQPSGSRPYYYRGDPARTPDSGSYQGSVPQPPRKANNGASKRAEDRLRRYEEFCALRRKKVSVTDAGERVGVHYKTARRYERDRLAAPEAKP
jgi:hypothetical protein